MSNSSPHDPYAGNVLIEGLGPVLTREDAYKSLMYLPPPPRNPGEIPLHLRLHHLLSVRDLHIPSAEGAKVHQSIDLLTRQGYRYRNPAAPKTWSHLTGEPNVHKTPRAPAMAALVVGHSGTGKTEAILRALNCYPTQVITHDSFPRLKGPHHQMVALSVDVPPSGAVQIWPLT